MEAQTHHLLSLEGEDPQSASISLYVFQKMSTQSTGFCCHSPHVCEKDQKQTSRVAFLKQAALAEGFGRRAAMMRACVPQALPIGVGWSM